MLWKRLFYALLLQTWQFCDICALFGEFSLFLTLLCVQYILSFLTFRTCFLVVVCKLGLRVMSSYIGRRHESSNTEQWTCTFLLINIFIDNIEPKELSYWENVWQIKTNRVEWGRGARMKKRNCRIDTHLLIVIHENESRMSSKGYKKFMQHFSWQQKWCKNLHSIKNLKLHLYVSYHFSRIKPFILILGANIFYACTI